MRNKFLTIQVWRFLYHMARIRTKPYKKHNVMYMDDEKWNKWLTTKKELGL